ncbi:MAG: DUF4013 domain-containing protein [Candidatus Aenigmarchaeota archaeon]|nr:DUF4013 domain-containing protein [Candidatus Aenigmarchaeota archaeon]
MVNYGEAIRKPFTDLAKLVIGIVLTLIPIVHWIAKGFILESSGMGKTKPSKTMPEWKNWGNLFVKGLLSDIILLIYAIPAIVVFIVGAEFRIMTLISGFLSSIITPELLGEMKTGEVSSEVISQIISQNWAMALPTLMTLAPVILLAFILLIIAFYLTPIAVLNYIKTNEFSEAFRLSIVLKKALTGKYFVVWIVTIIITAIAVAILAFIPVLGLAIAIFVSGVIAYSLYGQIYRET